MAIIAIVVAMGVLSVVVVTVAKLTLQIREAEAQRGGCLNAAFPGVPFNASKGRCFRG